MPSSKPSIKRRKAKKNKAKSIARTQKKSGRLVTSNAPDDELSSFLLNSLGVDANDDYGLPVGITARQPPKRGRWIRPNESIKIKGRTLDRGFIYVGEALKPLDGFGTEPALIDTTCPATAPGKVQHSDHIAYDAFTLHWLRYTGISKESRGIFLDWLASKRSDSDIHIGYVLIYFYGLERRVIADISYPGVDGSELNDNEFIAIFDEVARLRKVYGYHEKFNKSAGKFLQLMAMTRPPIFTEKHLRKIPENSLLIHIKLAETVKKRKPVSADLAVQWVTCCAPDSFAKAIMYCDAMFKKLFILQYKKHFVNGIKIKPHKTSLQLEYQPTSHAMNSIAIDIKHLPHPYMNERPFEKMIAIADLCVNQLADYNRYLGKTGSSENDTAALVLLPTELINTSAVPIINNFKQWANKVIYEQQGLTTVKAFWSHLQLELPKAINKKEHLLMQQFAKKAGFSIAPAIDVHQEKLQPAGNIVLFNVNSGHDIPVFPGTLFNRMNLSLRLGAMVVTANEHIDEKKHAVLKNLIDQNDTLSAIEKQFSHAYLKWRLNAPTTMVGVKAKLEKMDSNEKQLIRQFLISVALTGGKTDANEIRQIEKCYTALGFDKSLVPGDIHGFSSGKAYVAKPAYQSGNKQKNTIKSHFELDKETLALHKEETHSVQKILEDIFTEDTTEEVQKPATETVITGLDCAHQMLYEKLITKETWSRKDMLALCDKLCLMMDGAIETINDWSFESVNAPLIDDDGDFCVDFEIVEELRG